MGDAGLEVQIDTADGATLGGRLFRPPTATAPVAAIVIAGAVAVRQLYYAPFSRYLAEQGFHVLTFDYRGIGTSRAGRVFDEACMREWGEEDLSAAIDWLHEEYPGVVLGLGHSAGGQMFGLAPSNHRIGALVTVSAQSGYWGHWPAHLRAVMALLWYVALPGATLLFSRFPARRMGIGEDLPKRVALEFARWCRHRDYLVDTDGKPIRAGFRAFEAPILALSFEDDAAAPRRAVDALHEFYENAPVERRSLTPRELGVKTIGHFGFFRERFRASLWAEAAEWLGKAAEMANRGR